MVLDVFTRSKSLKTDGVLTTFAKHEQNPRTFIDSGLQRIPGDWSELGGGFFCPDLHFFAQVQRKQTFPNQNSISGAVF